MWMLSGYLVENKITDEANGRNLHAYIYHLEVCCQLSNTGS